MENIISFVNICVKDGDYILLINRQHDHFKGWIPPGGKVIFPESFFEAAVRELEEETGLVATNLVLKGISGFTNEGAYERHVYYDFLCTAFSRYALAQTYAFNPCVTRLCTTPGRNPGN